MKKREKAKERRRRATKILFDGEAFDSDVKAWRRRGVVKGKGKALKGQWISVKRHWRGTIRQRRGGKGQCGGVKGDERRLNATGVLKGIKMRRGSVKWRCRCVRWWWESVKEWWRNVKRQRRGVEERLRFCSMERLLTAMWRHGDGEAL